MPDLDYFFAELSCPVCNTMQPVAMDTDIQTDPHGIYLQAGSVLELGEKGVEEGKYLKLNEPIGRQVVILSPWECSACGAENWASITLEENRIESIESTLLTKESLDNAHFISSLLDFFYEKITGVRLYQPLDQPTPTKNFQLRPDWVERLKEKI